MLREHVVGPQVPSGIPDDDAVHPGPEDGRPAFRSAWQERKVSRGVDDEPTRGAPPGAAAANDRLGVEEIMERLAEEMEAEYVRTYGSSGG